MTHSPVPLLDVTRFDRTAVLSQNERDALTTLGWQLRRRRSHDAELPEWDMVGRLLAPLDAARSALCDRPDTPLHRRSAKDAVGLVLRRCAEEGTAFWGWSEDTWVGLVGEDRHAFARPWPSWVDQTYVPMWSLIAISSAASMHSTASAASTVSHSPGACSGAKPWNSPRGASSTSLKSGATDRPAPISDYARLPRRFC